MTHSPQPDSKHEKYQSQNPISRYLIRNFLDNLYQLVEPLKITSLIDVGCGEGMVLNHLAPLVQNISCRAIDLDPAEVEDAQRNLPFAKVQQGSAYQLPVADSEVDLLLCTEVLEHLDNPEQALTEFYRATARYAILTVPREPVWCALNMARGAYWRHWGNTPGHLNHWSSGAFRRFVSTHFEVISMRQPLPWTMLLLQKRNTLSDLPQ